MLRPAVPLPDRQRSAGRSRRPWRRALAGSATTPGRLRLLFSVIILTTAVVGATAVVTVLNLRDTAATVAERTSPAVIDAAHVRAVLADADRVAVQNLFPARTGAQRTTSGPGTLYQGDITIAGQALERAADNNTTGQSGRMQLQAVNDLLVVYMGLVGQAQAYGTADAIAPGEEKTRADLAVVYLAYAAEQMRAEDTGILAKVEQFRLANQEKLPDEGSRPWLPLGIHLTAGLVLLGLLVGTQVFFRRRFHRRASPWLLAAAVVVLLVCGYTTTECVRTGRALDDSVRETDQITCLWQARTVAAIAGHDDRFSYHLSLRPSEAGTPPGDCTARVPIYEERLAKQHAETLSDRLLREEDSSLQILFRNFMSDTGDDQDSTYDELRGSLQKSLEKRLKSLEDALDSAVPTRGLEWIILWAASIGGFVVLAFRPRVREYRAGL